MPIFLSRKKLICQKNDGQSKGPAEICGEQDIIRLAELESGRAARVCRLQGGPALAGRLRSFGIIPGTVIVKKSDLPSKGPIVVKKGTVQFAVSYRMAESILVEPVDHGA